MFKKICKAIFGDWEKLEGSVSYREYDYEVRMFGDNPPLYLLVKEGDGCGMATGTLTDIENYIKTYKLQNVKWNF